MLDPHVDDLHAILAGEPLQARLDIVHHLIALGAEQCRERLVAKLVADRAAEQRPQRIGDRTLGLRRAARRVDRLQRIDDTEARIGIHLEPQLVGREHLLVVVIDVQHALVQPYQPVDERNPQDRSRAGPPELFVRLPRIHRAHRLFEAQDHHLLRLGHDHDRRGEQDDQDQRRHAERDRVPPEPLHWPPPVVVTGWVGVTAAGAAGTLSGRRRAPCDCR